MKEIKWQKSDSIHFRFQSGYYKVTMTNSDLLVFCQPDSAVLMDREQCSTCSLLVKVYVLEVVIICSKVLLGSE